MTRNNVVYTVGNAYVESTPIPVISSTTPAATNTNYPLGQVWLDQTSGMAYILAKVASSTATWNVMTAGSADINTMSADTGGSLTPSAGNMIIAGGTNISTAGSGHTITVNLDAAVTLATSLTTPIVAASGADLNINADTNFDIIMKMGDAGGAQKVSLLDSGTAEVASIDSDGNFSCIGTGNVDGNFTVGGNLILSSVAKYIQMNGGADTDFIGQATLAAGTVTVSNTNISANDRIILTRAGLNSSTALGELTITAQTASTSFVITAIDPSDGASTVAGDLSVVNYVIIRQN